MSEQLPVIDELGAVSPQTAAGSLPPIGPPPVAYAPRRAHSLAANNAAGTVPWIARWDADEFEIAAPGLLRVGGALLKSQGQVARDLHNGHGALRYMAGCAAVLAFSTCGYGAIIGSFVGVEQAFMAALKLPLIVAGASAICLPSFYVFQCLMGARLTLRQAAQSILLLASAASLILLACAPIVWFFSMSTQMDSPAFVALLHVAVLGLAAMFGVQFILRMHRYLAQRSASERLFDGRVLAAWLLLFLLVSAQMACFMGPLMSEGPFFSGERGLFVGAFFRLMGR